MRLSTAAALALAALLSACGSELMDGSEGDSEGVPAGELDSEEAAVTSAKLEGTIVGTGEALGGAVVLAQSRAGVRVGRTTTAANGTYSLPVSSMPWRLVVVAFARVPRVYVEPALTKIATGRYRFNTDVGPRLGADGTSENLTYVIADAANSPHLVPQMAWGNGGGLGSPWDEVSDLTVGARLRELSSLLPSGTRVTPNAEQAVVRRTSAQGDYLEARFSEQLNTQSLGSTYEALLIEQIVSTASIAYGPQNLPVRIRVRCTSCADGYTSFNDSHVGPSGPGGSYPLYTARPERAFSDLGSARHPRHVAMAKGLGIVRDFASGTSFAPSAAITRAELAALLVRTLGMKVVTPAQASYKDVRASDWFYALVETARAKGLMSGGSDGNFRPNAPVTRAELASYLVHAARWTTTTPARGTFADVAPSYWAFTSIETANGYCHSVEARDEGRGTFAPTASTTREEAVVGVLRAANCFTGLEIR